MSETLPIRRERLLQLLPHAGAMCLLDTVQEFSAAEIRCTSRSHRDPAHPLRRGQKLAAIHLVEYAAQAAAAHGALLADGRAQPGMLAALRAVSLYVEEFGDVETDLTIVARRRLAQSDGLLYEFSALAGSVVLADGRIAIALT